MALGQCGNQWAGSDNGIKKCTVAFETC